MTSPTLARSAFALCLGLALVVWAGAAFAQAYKYRDDRGHVHFTENLHDIPAKYRKQVETRDMPRHEPAPGSPEAEAEAAADSNTASMEASFKQGLEEGMGSSMTPDQQKVLDAWVSRWVIPFVLCVVINMLLSMGLIVHAFTQGHVGWGLANFFIGISTPVYLMLHVEQGIGTRLSLLMLYLSPGVVAGIACAQLIMQMS